MSKLQQYHYVWLAAHPYRTEEWLRIQLKDSFDVHHIDGNHDNNVADNLILIEHGDHMWLHKSTRRLRQITTRGKKYKIKRFKELVPPAVETEQPIVFERQPGFGDPHGYWVTCANTWKVYIRRSDSEETARAKIAEFATQTW